LGPGQRRVDVAELVPGFEPETELERALARDPALLEGWAWGKPREGHPEGEVGEHVGHLLDTIDEWGVPEPPRSELRFIALVHDSLKYRVQDWRPKTGENHHAMRARRFAESYTGDERILATIELHDRPYAIWRRMRRKGESQDERVREMLARVPDRELFLRFVELDGSTEGKRPEPVEWLRGLLTTR
jgi:HD domain-containing protein